MSVAAKKDFERVSFSISIAILIHLFIFFVLPLVINIHTRELPEYSGPIYVTLEVVPAVSAEKAVKSLETLKPAVKTDKNVSAEKTEKGQEPSAAVTEKTAGRIIQKNETKQAVIRSAETETQPVKQSALWKEIPSRKSGESPVPSVKKPERSLLAEERSVNVPFVPPVVSKEKAAENAEQYGSKQSKENTEALGRNVYTSLDKLLKETSGTGESGSKGTVSSSGSASAGLPGTGTSAKAGVPIQWEQQSEARQPLYMPKPSIPGWVGEEGLKLVVVISFKLLPGGVISTIHVEKSSGYSDVDAAITEALRRWKFQAVRSSRVVKGRITYVIRPE